MATVPPVASAASPSDASQLVRYGLRKPSNRLKVATRPV
jgi:hypothetical protein